MPLFLDIHKLPDDVTPEAVQDAHTKDVEVQGAYGVNYQGYWYNHPERTVACLVEGPNKEACIEVHRKAHGLVADLIIEVNAAAVQSFLGGGVVAPTGDVFLPDGTRDPGVRVLLVTEIANLAAVGSQAGDEAALKLVEEHDRVIRGLLTKYGGREVRHTGDGMMLSFPLASAAVQCALEVQREFAKPQDGSESPAIRMGLAAGEPVTQHEKIFGATVEQARAICRAAQPGEILTSVAVRDLCAGKGLNFASAPTIRAPGVSTPLDTARALGLDAKTGKAVRATGSGDDHLHSQTVLGGRYIVEREIGRGGMATVYSARDSRHDRPVAVKVLRRELAAGIGPDRFLQEIRVAARLTHPNIVALHDSGDVDGILYYVMPYLGGETLREVLGRERTVPLGRAIEIGRRLAVALDYAHRHGIVHRDIKPENIMLLEGEPMILDFGIALALSQAGTDRLTSAGLSLGTPTYMSPEQAAGEETIDARTDVYALGCVIYEMIAGEPPFTGSPARALMARVLAEPPPRLAQTREHVPAHVDAAVFRALAKSPDDRFESAGAFAAALSGK
jgi:class 3 adenylate cyclase